MSSGNVYDERNIRTMETVWGRGYMSPGGDSEVERIVANVDLNDATVLDFGCGTGGASVAMARMGLAARIVSVDIEASVLNRARTLATQAGVSDRIQWQLIAPGPLPFEDRTFDVVYANSVTCHIRDLKTLARDMVRVLKPNGKFIGSEWYVGPNEPAFLSWDDLLRERGLNFYFVTDETFESCLLAGGFQSVSFNDRSAAMTRIAVQGQRRVAGELRASLRAELGDEGFAAFSDWGRLRAEVLESEGMRHGHFIAAK